MEDGLEIWVRFTITGFEPTRESLLLARQIELRLLSTFDYPWNEDDNQTRRPQFELVHLNALITHVDEFEVAALLPFQEKELWSLVSEKQVVASQRVIRAPLRKQGLQLDLDSEEFDFDSLTSSEAWSEQRCPSTLSPRTPGIAPTTPMNRRRSFTMVVGDGETLLSPSKQASRPMPVPTTPRSRGLQDIAGASSSPNISASLLSPPGHDNTKSEVDMLADRVMQLENRVARLETEKHGLFAQLNAERQRRLTDSDCGRCDMSPSSSGVIATGTSS